MRSPALRAGSLTQDEQRNPVILSNPDEVGSVEG